MALHCFSCSGLEHEYFVWGSFLWLRQSGRGVFDAGEVRDACARPSTLTASLLPHVEPPLPALTGPPVSNLLFTVLRLLYDFFAEHHHLARQKTLADARWRPPKNTRTGTPRSLVSLSSTILGRADTDATQTS